MYVPIGNLDEHTVWAKNFDTLKNIIQISVISVRMWGLEKNASHNRMFLNQIKIPISLINFPEMALRVLNYSRSIKKLETGITFFQSVRIFILLWLLIVFFPLQFVSLLLRTYRTRIKIKKQKISNIFFFFFPHKQNFRS